VAAVDYFLKIDGIEGESRDARHKGAIELESFSWGEASTGQQPGGGGGGAGKVRIGDLRVVMKLNKASPLLLLACASGQHLKQVMLTTGRPGKMAGDFLVYKLSDVLVSAYNTAGTREGAPTDEIAFSFARIEVEYRPQKADGSLDTPVKAGWDVKANRKI
jgi:type VI secretion system secreted protein Hcp